MNKLLKEVISYILEVDNAAVLKAKKDGYKSLGGGYWSKSGEKPAEATTRGGIFRVLTPDEKKALEKGDDDKDTETLPPEVVRIQDPEQLRGTRKPKGKAIPTTPEPGELTTPAPEGAENTNTKNLADLVRKGFKSPGNDFSKYSEAVSIIMSKYLVDNQTAADIATMERIIELDCGSATLTKEVGVTTIPKNLKARYEALKKANVFDKCPDSSEAQNKARFMTMVVAQKKAELMSGAIERSGLTSVSIDAFSGDVDSRQKLRSAIENLPDGAVVYTETGETLTREEALERIDGFGTAKFPADTALLGRDASGNAILIGFSDKKDLSAIMNNSSISVEMEQTRTVLNQLLKDGKISAADHKQMSALLEAEYAAYVRDERELSETVSEPATVLASSKQLKQFVKKAKAASGGSDPEKYWRRVSKFQEQATKNATPSNKTEYLQWLRQAGWDGKSKVSDELAMRAWALKCKSVLESGGQLAKPDQELLFRLEVVPKKKIVESVAAIKGRAMGRLKTIRDGLDAVKINGRPLGTYMDGVRAWHALHLDMKEHKGSLVMVAEDNVVDYDSLEECLGGISERQDFIDNLDIEQRDITSREYGVVTGTSLEVFSVGRGGQRNSIGVRSIRSKDGILGRLQTTWNFHPQFRKCLESKKG